MLRNVLQTLAASIVLFTAASTVAEEAILNLTNGNAEVREITRSELEAMPVTEFATSTIWTEGVVKFKGVSLFDFKEAMSLDGETIKAVAINDYAVEIPMKDAVEGGPMIAYLMNDKEMSARDKGPLWVIYPFDHNSEYQVEAYYSRSIWQLDRISVTD